MIKTKPLQDSDHRHNKFYSRAVTDKIRQPIRDSSIIYTITWSMGNPVLEHLPCVYKALVTIPSTAINHKMMMILIIIIITETMCDDG
jgi:hypothetical protein